MNSSNGNVHDQNLQQKNGTPIAPIGFQQYSGPSGVGCDLTPADLAGLETRWIRSGTRAPRQAPPSRLPYRAARLSAVRAGTTPALSFPISTPAPF